MIECNKIAWHHYHGALLPTVLPHQEVILSRRDIKNLLKQSNAYFLRWTNEWDCKKSKFWYVVKDTFSDMDQLSANTRSKIRRAGKRCFIKKVDKETIAKNGYEVYKNAFDK